MPLQAEHDEQRRQPVDGEERAVQAEVERVPECLDEADNEAYGRVHHPGQEHVLAAGPRVDGGEQGVDDAEQRSAHHDQQRGQLHGRPGVAGPGGHDEHHVGDRDRHGAVVNGVAGRHLAHQPGTGAGEDAGHFDDAWLRRIHLGAPLYRTGPGLTRMSAACQRPRGGSPGRSGRRRARPRRTRFRGSRPWSGPACALPWTRGCARAARAWAGSA